MPGIDADTDTDTGSKTVTPVAGQVAGGPPMASTESTNYETNVGVGAHMNQ